MTERLELADELIELVTDHHGYMRRHYGEQIERYQQASRFGKLLIAQRYPEVAEYVAYMDAQQSVIDAQNSAYANEGRIVIF